MHELLNAVLEKKDLSRAGELFNIPDWEIIADLPTSLVKLKDICCTKAYSSDVNNQSVVEICLARVISAIRDTNTIGTFAPLLVDLLESCLQYDLGSGVGEGTSSAGAVQKEGLESAHAKIASDLLSCLFLHYTNKSVMTVAVPVGVKVLSCSNKELVRSASSYLSLAAIYSSRVLSQFAPLLIKSVVDGNSALARVLPQIYPDNREPFHAQVSQLVNVLTSSDIAEQLSILQLLGQITDHNCQHMVPYLNCLKPSLLSAGTCSAVLSIYLSLVTAGYASALSDQTGALRKATQTQSAQNVNSIVKILSAIAKSDKNLAEEVVKFFAAECPRFDGVLVSVLLREIDAIAIKYPGSIRPQLSVIVKLADQCKNDTGSQMAILARIKERCSDTPLEYTSSSKPTRITVISVDSSASKDEQPSVANKSQPKVVSELSQPPAPSSAAITAQNAISSSNTSAHKTSPPPATSQQPKQRLPQDDDELPNIDVPHLVLCRDGRVRVAPGASRHHMANLSNLSKPKSRSVSYLSNNSNAAARQCAIVTPGKSSQHEILQEKLRAPGGITKPAGMPVQQMRTSSRLETTFKNGGSITTTRTAGDHKTVIHLGDSVSQLSRGSRDTFGSGVTSVQPQPRYVNVGTQSTATLLSGTSSVDQLQLGNNVTVFSQSPTVLQMAAKGADAVHQFCEKHLKKIRDYMLNFELKYPVPCQCTIEEAKHKQHMRVHFMCQENGDHCLHRTNFFAFKTKIPHIWMHVMFLHMQSQSSTPLSQKNQAVVKLKICWEYLPGTQTKKMSFAALVTSAFPNFKEEQLLLNELQTTRYFDSFAYNAGRQRWSCFACNHPERVETFLKHGNYPVIEGQLKEKKGRWKVFKRWRTRYFTLSSATLSYRSAPHENANYPAIDLRSIRSVKSVSSRRGKRNIPKAFEIFTDDECSYVFKATDHRNAEEWFQCLQIAVAQVQKEKPHAEKLYAV